MRVSDDGYICLGIRIIIMDFDEKKVWNFEYMIVYNNDVVI